MIKGVRFVAAIILYFIAANLIEDFFDIKDGTVTWLIIELFSGAIGITAAFFVSSMATMVIGLYLMYDIGSTIWNLKGFGNILMHIADPMIQFVILGVLMENYKEATGKEYGEDDLK